MTRTLTRWLPMLDWLPDYGGRLLLRDGVAAVVVSLLLIPQALAYALLAGVPPVVGLYASMLPLVVYAVFGTCHTLTVGPFAVVAIMAAAAVGHVVAQTGIDHIPAMIALTLLSGLVLLGLGLCRLGFLVNFLGRPVITGFISASGLLIACSQIGHFLAVPVHGQTIITMATSLWQHRAGLDIGTLAIGVSALAVLLVMRRHAAPALQACGIPTGVAAVLARCGPVLVVIVAIACSAAWHWDQHGVAVIGAVTLHWPDLSLPPLRGDVIPALVGPAVLISIVTLTESLALAKTLAFRRGQRIAPNRELVALGMMNLASGLSGAFPVSASMSRSAVNEQAGAATPMTNVLLALIVAVAALGLTPLLRHLPLVVLAAIIIQAVLSLVEPRSFVRTWRYAREDGLAQIVTFVMTLTVGITTGLAVGVALSFMLYVYRTSRPHSAVVGRVPGTEHFRNVRRHDVEVDERVVFLRIDESLYFGNADALEDAITDAVGGSQSRLRHLVLTCPAVNDIDVSALEKLEQMCERLRDRGIRMHLAEVKGPVMDKLAHTNFLNGLTGRVFLSTFAAWQALARADSD